jgi:hypothetical protein
MMDRFAGVGDIGRLGIKLISIVGLRAACVSIAICACAHIAQAAITLGPSTIEAYASGTTVSDQEQNITGPGNYSQTASATASGTGGWTGYWTWTGQQWQWTWVYLQTGQNTASYAVTVATAGGLSIAGSASALQTNNFPTGNAFVTLTSAFSVTGNAELASLSATLAGTGSSISLTDTTDSQTLFTSTTTFLPTSISLPAGDQFLLEYNTTSTFPGSDNFSFTTVPEPAGTGILISCAALFVARRPREHIWPN